MLSRDSHDRCFANLEILKQAKYYLSCFKTQRGHALYHKNIHSRCVQAKYIPVPTFYYGLVILVTIQA